MLRTDFDRYLNMSLRLLLYGVVLGVGYIVIKLSFAYFTPFIIALALSVIVEPLVKLFQKMHLGRGISSITAIILFLGVFLTISVFTVIRVVFELRDLYNSLPLIYNQLYAITNDLIQKATDFYLQLTPEATEIIEDLLNSSFDKMKIILGQILSRTPQSTINFISSLSGTFIFLIITIIATFFVTKDKKMITEFFLRQLSPSWQDKFITLKDDLFVALIGFLKAQSIILSVTFLESFIGMSLIGIDYAILIAIIVALVDILPILGTGSVYVPWAIISFINGDFRLGISLLILYGVIVVVRYMIEPKVVGTQLGIHPVVALVSMFAGLKILGVVGIILGPTLVVVIKACQHAGIIPKFK